MAKRVLVTGAHGFIGKKLVSALQAFGYEVYGPAEGAFDIANPDSVRAALGDRRWDVVVHLAAISHVPTCEKDPDKAFRINRDGTALLFDELKKRNPGAHFVFASSATVYRAPSGEELNQELVFDESRPVEPMTIYARSKAEAEQAIQRAADPRSSVTITRFFNHTHKTQSPDFFLPHLFSVLSKAEKGMETVVPVGNLDLERDFGAVSDLVEALVAIVRKEWEPGIRVFNISSGVRRNLRELAQAMAARLGVRARFETDPSRVRPGEPLSICGSHEALTGATGWKPRHTSQQQFLDAFLSE